MCCRTMIFLFTSASLGIGHDSYLQTQLLPSNTTRAVSDLRGTLLILDDAQRALYDPNGSLQLP
jgi:hypothetical protein